MSGLFWGLMSFALPLMAGLAAAQPIAFKDVTRAAGLDPALGETFSVNWVDYDGDGDPDLWLGNHEMNGGGRPHLFRNDGGFFTDITEAVYTGNPRHDTHGAVWADFDNDGAPDLWETVGGEAGLGTGPNYLFRQEARLVDVAAARRLAYPHGRGRMGLWLDYDRDGRLDALQANAPRPDGIPAPSTLFRQLADGTFEEANRPTGFDAPAVAKFALAADLDGDFIPEILLPSNDFPQRVYDTATLPFADRADAFFPATTTDVQDAALADFDGDGWLDVFLVRRRLATDFFQANDTLLYTEFRSDLAGETGLHLTTTGVLRLTDVLDRDVLPADRLFLGGAGQPPTDARHLVAAPTDPAMAGLADRADGLALGYDPARERWTLRFRHAEPAALRMVVSASAPITAIERFGSPDPGLPPVLWRFDPASGRFVDHSARAGLADRPFACTNVAAGDFDNDMDVDVYLACAELAHQTANILLENLGDGTFRERAAGAEGPLEASVTGVHEAPARVAVADYDGDGYLDLVLPSTNPITARQQPVAAIAASPLRLLRNTGGGQHWMAFDLVGTEANRDGLGAVVEVWTGARRQVRHRTGGGHRFAQDAMRLHVGLGPHALADSVVVHWPSGRTDTHAPLPANAVYRLVEGSAGASRQRPVRLSIGLQTLSLFPNPTATTARLRLSTNAAVPLRAEVYDVLGRRVARLFDGLLNGVHEGTVGEGLGAGVYLLRITDGQRGVTHLFVKLRP